jgi:hypothetical protein
MAPVNPIRFMGFTSDFSGPDDAGLRRAQVECRFSLQAAAHVGFR